MEPDRSFTGFRFEIRCCISNLHLFFLLCALSCWSSLFQISEQKSTSFGRIQPALLRRYQFTEFLKVDVPARNNCDDRPFASFPTERRSDWQRAGTLSNDTCFFSQQSHRIFCVLESDNETAVHNWFHAFPHAREHALTSSAVHE